GVAGRQLVVEGIASEGQNPVLQSLAARLHRLHIGAVVFQRGVTPAELMEVVSLLAAEEERGVAPLGMRDPERLRAWSGVRLYPLAYDQLGLVEGGEDEASKATELWLSLARAALAGDTEEDAAASAEPAEVARAINARTAAVGYDQVIVGCMLQIAEELGRTGDGPGRAA